MSNSYFNFTTGRMVAGENALAEDVNSGFDAVAAGFDKLPTPDATKFLAGAHETTSGSAGNFVLAVTADSYFDGMSVSFKANHSNSGACTLNVGSLGAKSLVDGNGAVLAVGDIVANSIYAARYNSTSDKFHLVGLSSGNAADAAVVAANIADVATIADNIDELLLVDDNAIAAAASASDASGYADDALTQAGLASDYADAAAESAANLPNATTAGADKVVVSNTAGDGWEYPSVTAAGKALLDDADAAAQRATLGFPSDSLTRPRKNMLINGWFDVWQRGTSFAATGTYYTADRWEFVNGPGGGGVEKATNGIVITYTFNGAQTFRQKIENVRKFSDTLVTFSFNAWDDLATGGVVLAIKATQNFGTGGTPAASVVVSASETVAVTSSSERYTATIALPSISGKALGTNNDSFLMIEITPSRPASDKAVGLDLCQLEFGDTATDFEYRHLAEELMLCKYYFERVDNTSSVGSGYQYSNGVVANARGLSLSFTPKRIVPTVTYTGYQVLMCTYANVLANTQSLEVRVNTTGAGSYRIWDGVFDIDAEL